MCVSAAKIFTDAVAVADQEVLLKNIDTMAHMVAKVEENGGSGEMCVRTLA